MFPILFDTLLMSMQLGDFGSARMTYNTDPKNPKEFIDPTTLGYRAPEMTSYNSKTNTIRSSATNACLEAPPSEYSKLT